MIGRLTTMTFIAATLLLIQAGCGDQTDMPTDVTATELPDTATADVISPDDTETGDANRLDGGDISSDNAANTDEDVGTDSGGKTDTAQDVQAGDSQNMDVPHIECQPQTDQPVIRVTVYEDLLDETTSPKNNQSKTDHVQTFNQHDNPWPGIDVTMTGLSTDTLSKTTCDQGWLYFGPDNETEFTDGVRMLDIALPDCRITTHNYSRRTSAALAQGRWKMTVFGDSIPVLGTSQGKFFFDNVSNYLIDYMGSEDGILVINWAISGSVTSQWLPDTLNFKNKILPELDDTDVVFISLGGNDIMHYAYNNAQSKPLDQLMEGITQTISSVQNNLEDIFAAIRSENPDVDIVWLIYPNYAKSEKWQDMVGPSYGPLIESYFEDQMYGIVSWAAGIEGLLLVDLFSRMNKDDLDSSLFDELHYNEYGHQILGDELMKILGGVVISEGILTVGPERMIGVACD